MYVVKKDAPSVAINAVLSNVNIRRMYALWGNQSIILCDRTHYYACLLNVGLQGIHTTPLRHESAARLVQCVHS